MRISKAGVFLFMCTLALWSQTVEQRGSKASERTQPRPSAVETEIIRAPEQAGDLTPVFTPRHPRYLLRAGDLLDLTFSFTPELNQTVSVQPDGFISLQEVGDVRVAGMDLPQVRNAVLKAYAEILREPKLDIKLKEFEKPYFIAHGQVKIPGKYEMRGDTTVTEAVAMAGGFTDAAKHSQVLVFRRLDRERVQVKKLDIKSMLAAKDLGEDIYLRPGDMVYVPKSQLSKLKEFVLPRATVGPSIYPGLR